MSDSTSVRRGEMAESQSQDAAPRKSLKRKRSSSVVLENLTPEEKEARISALNEEIDGLLRYYREVMDQKLGLEVLSRECCSLNAQIACLMEESDLPLSALVEQIYGSLKEMNEGLTVAAVKSGLLFVGQRIMYGVPNPEADVLEDHSSSTLWCWETRDMKLLPKSAKWGIKTRRTCRKKIHERISAISEMLSVLRKLEGDQTYTHDSMNASENLVKTLSESDIRALVDSLTQRNVARMVEKEAKQDEKACIKQMERSKRKAEKEKKRMELQLQKEKLKAEKELKRLQEEADKEEKRRLREESELNKQLRKQQEEAERDQRRREKQEAEMKRQLALQKQASIMERFLSKTKKTTSHENEKSSSNLPGIPDMKSGMLPDAATDSMDSFLSLNREISAADIFKKHLSLWRERGHQIRSNKQHHWSLRRKPKAEIIEELKLTTTIDSDPVHDNELNIEKLMDGCNERVSEDRTCSNRPGSDGKKFRNRKQLLQFDKSHRPAFYGIWPMQSVTVRPRHPFSKDPELDYDIDSDEEWEEEDPGESLSDCDKDNDESLEEGCPRADEDEESEDGFFVPDGYLSENEGVEVDRMVADPAEAQTSPCEQDTEREDLSQFFRQNKYLCSVTEHALRKNQPLIISNLAHEKSGPSDLEKLSGAAKMEVMCLQALRICAFPGDTDVDISISNHFVGDEDSPSSNRDSRMLPPNMVAVSDSDLSIIVSFRKMLYSSGLNLVV
ncbi:hypothetical protein SAY86_028652 [Trapa natans]|uniref:Chromatin assembly factor 1 subunit A dimerization domain-containing protein n=1 Tax=Trapa natans TaxID=22666 RepID=A0AAN7MIQ8_TRANT|nr:hypothetical protein SAY86_028652 [Trapa natans]